MAAKKLSDAYKTIIDDPFPAEDGDRLRRRRRETDRPRLRQGPLRRRRRLQGPALRREPRPGGGPLQAGRRQPRARRSPRARAWRGPRLGRRAAAVRQAPRQDQPHRRGLRPGDPALPLAQARLRDHEAQQPLWPGLRLHARRGLPQGLPGRPRGGVRRLRSPQP